jgi:hypothetical protein
MSFSAFLKASNASLIICLSSPIDLANQNILPKQYQDKKKHRDVYSSSLDTLPRVVFYMVQTIKCDVCFVTPGRLCKKVSKTSRHTQRGK